MRLGIIGLPQCGKTTIFNALTRGSQPTGSPPARWKCTPRLWMSLMQGSTGWCRVYPKKTVYAKVTYADIAGLDGAQARQG